MRRGLLASSLALTLAACHRTVPLAAAPPPGMQVVAALDDVSAERHAQALGPRVRSIGGRVLDVTGDSLALAVAYTTTDDGRRTRWQGEPIRLARRELVRVGERRLDRRRSWALGAAASMAALAAGIGFARGGPGVVRDGGAITPAQ